MGLRGRGASAAAASPQDDALRIELFAMLEPLLLRYRDLFSNLDRDSDGRVTVEELIAAFDRRRLRFSEEKVRELEGERDEAAAGQQRAEQLLAEATAELAVLRPRTAQARTERARHRAEPREESLSIGTSVQHARRARTSHAGSRGLSCGIL